MIFSMNFLMIHKISSYKVRVWSSKIGLPYQKAEVLFEAAGSTQFFSKIRVEPALPNFCRKGQNCSKIPFCGVFNF